MQQAANTTNMRPSDLARLAAGDLAQLEQLARQHAAQLDGGLANQLLADALGMGAELELDAGHAGVQAMLATARAAAKAELGVVA